MINDYGNSEDLDSKAASIGIAPTFLIGLEGGLIATHVKTRHNPAIFQKTLALIDR